MEITTGSLARVEAFSDGVLAIIVTIMVLEFKVPQEDGWAAMLRLWPVFSAYLLSFVYVAIYWVNHHRLLAHARAVSNRLLWNNMALLFALSLVPFATAYLGQHHFSRDGALMYMGVLTVSAVFFSHLKNDIRVHGRKSAADEAYFRAIDRKGTLSVGLYAVGFGLAFVWPLAGIGCAGVVAGLWFMPMGRINRAFAVCGLK
jgi:uncharacterized membrane protein